jgi:hypothetical protein
MKIKITLFSFFLLVNNSLSAQNVGIGTNNPLEKLDINGDLYVRGKDIYMSHDNATNANNDYLSYDDVNTLSLGGNGVFHLHSDQARTGTWQLPSASISARGAYFAGRVGIGTNDPLTLTHISSGTANDAILRIEADTDNNNEEDNPRVELYQDGGQIGAMLGFFDSGINSGNTFRIGTRHSNIDNWNTFAINTLTQHVGIGTADPDQRLELNNGGMQINGTFGIGFAGDIPMDGAVIGDRAKIYYDNNFTGVNFDFLVFEKTDANNTDPDGGFVFTMKGSDNIKTTAMTIRGSARVGLQTVTNPTYALELPNNTATGTGRGRANAWVTYSDGRLKDQRKNIPYGLSTVLQLRPLQYQHHNSTTDESGLLLIDNSSSLDIGFVAQDLISLVPEAVYAPSDESKDLWAVDYTRLVPVLTKAIQEQQVTIKSLEEKYEAIEAQYNALQEQLNKSK